MLLLEHARPLLLPVTIAIVFTFVLSAPVRMLQRAGIHEYFGAAIVIAAVLALRGADLRPDRRAGGGLVVARAAHRP